MTKFDDITRDVNTLADFILDLIGLYSCALTKCNECPFYDKKIECGLVTITNYLNEDLTDGKE